MSLQLENNLIIAWRNLWRNKRRTIITISSIFFAVFFSILMRSFQLGTYNHMIDNIVTQFTGHLQIQDVEFMDNQSIDYSIPYTDSLTQIIENNKDIEFYFPRIQTGVLASSGPSSKASIIMGVEYEKENELIDLKRNVAEFYLDSNIVNTISEQMDEKSIEAIKKYKNKAFSNVDDLKEELFSEGLDTSKFLNEVIEKTKLPNVNYIKQGNEVLVGYKLAQYLELNVGDTIVLIGQGYQGATAAGKFKISGFLNFPTDAFNERIIYMPIHTSQIFLSAYDLDGSDTTFYVNYIAMNTRFQASVRENDYKKILKVKTDIEQQIKNPLITVVGWQNLNKDMIQGIQMDNESGKIMIFVLYLIISFGVLGTVMMMIAERKREFGVMMAIGMKRNNLSQIVAFEMFFMGILATLSGIIVTAPIIWLGHNHPIKLHGEMAKSLEMYNMDPVLPFQNFDTYIISQLIVVAVIVVIVLIYALLKIRQLKVISALRT